MANRISTSDIDQTQPLAARPPTGDEADPTPAGIPGRGDGPETTTAAERPALDGSGAAGSGRPPCATEALPVSFAPAGRRLAGLGISAPQFLTVLHRMYQGRTQRRLDHYLIHARVLGASDREARLVLAAVEETILADRVSDRIDPFELAAEVLTHQLAEGVGA